MRNKVISMVLLAAVLAACSATATEAPASLSVASPAAGTPSPTEAPAVDPFPDPVLQVTGEEEVVYDWSKDRCHSFDIPDLPSRAFRDQNGQVQMIISHLEPPRLVGPDLDHLAIDCHIVHHSSHNGDPAMHSDNEWIAAPYTEDGQTVYALVHNEYHGAEHSGQCPSGEYIQCWYNTVTLMVSKDGGESYDHAATPPDNFVAGLPIKYEPDGGVYGIFSPSNIVKGQDGYYYSLVKQQTYKTEVQSVCLMRTDDLSDPGSWRFWNGSAFVGEFVDPYKAEVDNAAAHTCPPLAPDEIGAQMIESLTFNTYLNRYVLVGISADQIGGREVWGFYYSFSTDLVHWSHRKLLMEAPLPWTVKNNKDVSYLYPVLLDPNSTSRNFETTGKTAYLYFTRHNFGQGSLDRDLIRVAVEISPGP